MTCTMPLFLFVAPYICTCTCTCTRIRSPACVHMCMHHAFSLQGGDEGEEDEEEKEQDI